MDTDGYRRQLALLREENEFLRAAAHAFGELAERLATELRQVRAEKEARTTKPIRPRRPTTTRLNG